MSYTYFIAADWSEGAISQHFKALAQRLVERGHRVVYLPHGRQVRIDEGNFQAYSFPSPRPTKPRDFIFLHRLVRQYKPDCMIANFGASNVMTLVGWLNHVPCRVNWYHTLSSQQDLDEESDYWKIGLLRLRKKVIYQLATHIIANSEATRLDVINTYGIGKSKTLFFYYSQPDVMPSLNVSHEASGSVVCAARLDHSKGQDVLIEALGRLKSVGIAPCVSFIGAGHKLDEYEALAKQLGIQDQCSFVGAVPHEEVFRKMAAAIFTVVLSRSEAFGLVNIESMSVGTPLIASAVGGIPEIIRDGVDGFLVPPDDPQVLADKIRLLYADGALREQMGRNARQRFLDVFEQKKNIEQQVLWFEDLVWRERS